MKETSTTHDVFVALPHPELLCLILQKTTHKVEILFFMFYFFT